jgi:hypothetical protein
MTDTVRERIVKYIVNVIENIDKLEPVGDPWGVQFSEVFRDPPETLATGKAAVAVVLDLTETKVARNFPMVEVQMPIDIEVHMLRDKGKKAGEMVNNALGCIEQAIRADFTCGGLCVDILVIATEKTPTDGPYENYVSGVLRGMVYFRHHADDPRSRI